MDTENMVKMGSKQKALIQDLQSEQETVLMAALETIRKDGTADLIPHLIQLLVHNDEGEMVFEATRIILNELKTVKAVEPIIKELSEEHTKDIRHILVGALWESGLPVKDHLLFLVDLAIKDDYLTCLECLTVIENIEDRLDDEDLQAGITQVQDALMRPSDKEDLLNGLIEVLNNFMMAN